MYLLSPLSVTNAVAIVTVSVVIQYRHFLILLTKCFLSLLQEEKKNIFEKKENI